MNEVREVLGNIPRGKTPGPDSLPYEIYTSRYTLSLHDALPISIMGNFVAYYGELYSDKPVDMPTLDRMIGNLTLKLDEKEWQP